MTQNQDLQTLSSLHIARLSGPFVQVTRRLASTTTGKDLFAGNCVTSEDKETKLRQDDYAKSLLS